MFPSIFSDELGKDITEAAPVIKSWGLKHVDLRAKVFGGAIEVVPPERLGELRKVLDDNDLKLGCIQSSLAKVHMPDQQRRDAEAEKLEGIIRVADALDCRLARVFFYWQPSGEIRGRLAELPDEQDKLLEMFAPLAERAKAGRAHAGIRELRRDARGGLRVSRSPRRAVVGPGVGRQQHLEQPRPPGRRGRLHPHDGQAGQGAARQGSRGRHRLRRTQHRLREGPLHLCRSRRARKRRRRDPQPRPRKLQRPGHVAPRRAGRQEGLADRRARRARRRAQASPRATPPAVARQARRLRRRRARHGPRPRQGRPRSRQAAS